MAEVESLRIEGERQKNIESAKHAETSRLCIGNSWKVNIVLKAGKKNEQLELLLHFCCAVRFPPPLSLSLILSHLYTCFAFSSCFLYFFFSFLAEKKWRNKKREKVSKKAKAQKT